MLSFASKLFRHGVHPPELKAQTADVRIRRMPFPREIVLPMRQHLGAPARCIARVGDYVERGDRVGEPQGYVSVPVHASAAGEVVSIGLAPHPDGGVAEAVTIRVDEGSAQAPRPRMIPEWNALSPDELVAAVRDAGVVGLGGAAFPTHVKLKPPDGTKLDTLLVNGCECEPYLTTDHRTMAEYPERVHLGIRIMMRCLSTSRAIVGVERNKPDAIEALTKTKPSDLDVEIVPLRVRYPQGAEKMLIQSVLDRQVPSGGLPMSVGVVVQNVASIATIAEVFETGLPLIERIVTVTGSGVAKPANLIVPVGTRLRDLLDACGGRTTDAQQVLLGGPMMGKSIADLDAPVIKGTTGVVALAERECRPEERYPCIRCGHCLDACPVFLNPQAMGRLAEHRRYDEMQSDYHLGDCMLCGCCSYVCPSNIPLSQLFAVARAAVRRQPSEPSGRAGS